MKRIFLCLIAAIFSASIFTAEASNLKFRADGSFKILQITDCHYKWGKSASEKCTENIRRLIAAEDPDLVIFTGDNVYSEGVMNSISAIVQPVEDAGKPFVLLFGNHDGQFEKTLEEQYDYFRSFQHNINPPRPDGVDCPDFVLPVQGSNGQGIKQLIYCFWSHAAYQPRDISRYDWVKFHQIEWYRQQSEAFTKQNGGTPIQALAFLHIPLPEYAEAYDFYSKDKKGHNVIGTKGEDVCCPKINSGLFASLYECGDVKGIFCGHDHDNDYALVWKNILLAYGRYSGGNTVYNHLGDNGGRLILVHEDSNDIETWIRLSSGEEINRCVYPRDFPIVPTK